MNQVCMNMKSEMNVKIKTCKRIMKTEENRCTLLWVKSFEIEKTLFGGCLSFSVIETSKSDLQASIVLFVHCQNWDYFHQKIIQRESPQNVRTATARDLSRKNCLQHSNAWQKKRAFQSKGEIHLVHFGLEKNRKAPSFENKPKPVRNRGCQPR